MSIDLDRILSQLNVPKIEPKEEEIDIIAAYLNALVVALSINFPEFKDYSPREVKIIIKIVLDSQLSSQTS